MYNEIVQINEVRNGFKHKLLEWFLHFISVINKIII